MFGFQPTGSHLDPIARSQIPCEVDFPVVDVGNGPRERDTLAHGQERVGDRGIEGVVQIRLNDRGGAEPLGRPRDLFDRLGGLRIGGHASHQRSIQLDRMHR